MHWRDIGGLETVKSKLRELIEWPTLFADKLARFHVSPPKGVLLYGPPGRCKNNPKIRLFENTAGEGGGDGSQHEFSLRKRPRTFLQICGRKRAGAGGGFSTRATQRAMCHFLRRNRRVRCRRVAGSEIGARAPAPAASPNESSVSSSWSSTASTSSNGWESGDGLRVGARDRCHQSTGFA